jgi:hypothetical protein
LNNLFTIALSQALGINWTYINVLDYQGNAASLATEMPTPSVSTNVIFIIYGNPNEVLNYQMVLEDQVELLPPDTIAPNYTPISLLSTNITKSLYQQPFKTNSPMYQQYNFFFGEYYSGPIYYIDH